MQGNAIFLLVGAVIGAAPGLLGSWLQYRAAQRSERLRLVYESAKIDMDSFVSRFKLISASLGAEVLYHERLLTMLKDGSLTYDSLKAIAEERDRARDLFRS